MSWWPRRRVYVDDLPETHDARFLTVFLVMFLAALGALYGVGYAVAGDKVPAGTSVAGAKIGGLTRAQARAVLEHQVAAQLRRPVTARAVGYKITFTPQQAGMTLDVGATMDKVMDGADWNPSHMLQVVEGRGKVEPVFASDPSSLAAVLAPLAAEVRTAPVSSAVVVRSGKAVVDEGRAGRRLDVAAASRAVTAALDMGSTSVSLTLTAVAPAVDDAAATAFVRETVQPALSRPVVISVAGRHLTVTPAQFGPALRVTSAGSSLHVGIDASDLLSRTSALLATLPGRPVNASVVFRDGLPAVTPGRAGAQVSTSSWAQAVLAAATVNKGRTASAAVTKVEPGVTTADATALDIKARISNDSRVADSHLSGILTAAAHGLDASVVMPGEDFSYVHSVGELGLATLRSQLGIATETAAERAHLAIISTPATAPSVHDLVFRNLTAHPIYIRAWVTPGSNGSASVVVEFWSSGR